MKTSNSQNLRRVLVLLSMAVLLCWGAVAFADEDFVPSPDATICQHESIFPEYNENEHWFVCEDCGKIVYMAQPHQLDCVDGWCVECGAENVNGIIRHEYEYDYNETHHWYSCPYCGTSESKKEHFVSCDNPDPNECLGCGATDIEAHIAHATKYESISETQHKEVCACGEIDLVLNHTTTCDSGDLGACMWCHKENVVCVVSHYNITGEYEFNEKEHWFTCNICQDMIVEAHFRLEDGTCIACDVIGLPAATPTVAPTVEPTAAPTAEPTTAPTAEPTLVPPMEPTSTPTAEPTAEPTTEPTVVPTAAPTATPTAEPTTEATAVPTITPTVEPTATPTAVPTAVPTTAPTAEPTATPSAAPTAKPTTAPKPVATVAPSANNSNEVKIKPIKMLEQELKEEAASYASAVTIKVPIETLKETVDEATYEQIVQMPVHEKIVVILSVLSDGNGQTNLLEDAGIAISEESKAVVQSVVESVSVLDEESTAAFQQLLEENFPKQEVTMDDKAYVYYLIPMYVTVNDVTQVKYYAFCFDVQSGKWLFTIIDEGEDALAALEQAKEDAE